MAELTPSDREDFIKYQTSLEEYFQAKKHARDKVKTKNRSNDYVEIKKQHASSSCSHG